MTDAVSYELLKGATVDYTTDLIRASFEVCNLGLGMASNGLTNIYNCPSQIVCFVAFATSLMHIKLVGTERKRCVPWSRKEETHVFCIIG